jgi:uncharacterized protein
MHADSQRPRQPWLPPAACITPIVKPVGNRCNLRCAYCFYAGQDQQGGAVMERSLLERILREVLALAAGRVRFIWHGGEPLLAGMDFYANALRIQQALHASRHGAITNLVQTNATLLDGEWVRFFKRHGFGVGISLDGAERSHNWLRRDGAGRGAFKATLRGIEALRAEGVEFGVIQVISRASLDGLEEDYRFFTRGLGLKRWSVNPYMAHDKAGLHDAHLSPERYTEYLHRLLDLWLATPQPRPRIRELDNLIAGVAGGSPRLCQFTGDCARYITIERDGGVYPCDRFSGDARQCWGDLRYQPLAKILSSAPRAVFAETTDRIPTRCRSCRFSQACRNGCAYQRQGGLTGLYYYCDTRRALYARIAKLIERGKLDTIIGGSVCLATQPTVPGFTTTPATARPAGPMRVGTTGPTPT